MKRAIWTTCGIFLLAAMAGCQCGPSDGGQGPLRRLFGCPGDGGGCKLGQCMHRERAAPAMNDGPPTGAVTYPYYTLHGPRDYFTPHPPNIGP